MKRCVECGNEIDPRRLKILPNTQTCVEHSQIEKKEALNVKLGEGEDTFDEIIILDKDKIQQILSNENETHLITQEKEEEDE